MAITAFKVEVHNFKYKMIVAKFFVQGEMKLLMELLPRYHDHVYKHPHTLLVKFFGLHRVKPVNGSKVRRHFKLCD